jgi:hypothetical protein
MVMKGKDERRRRLTSKTRAKEPEAGRPLSNLWKFPCLRKQTKAGFCPYYGLKLWDVTNKVGSCEAIIHRQTAVSYLICSVHHYRRQSSRESL